MRSPWDTNYSVNRPTTRYFYDGQMGIEEDFAREIEESMEVDVIRYGLGARGVDMIETDAYNSSPSAAYPLYDGHGNMVATLAKSGSNSFTVTARRYTDPWGVTRVGSATGKPDQRYCANLGHRQDDESGLTYMRARYYEAGTGRFVSEDPAKDGSNWFVYCRNGPVGRADASGENPISTVLFIIALLTLANTAVKLPPTLIAFVSTLHHATDSNEVESAWAQFMDGYNDSSLVNSDVPLMLRIISGAFTMSNAAFDKAPNWVTFASLATGSLNLGSRAVLLCYAYQLRIAWYIEDIDGW